MELVFFYFDQFKAFSMLNKYYIHGLNFLDENKQNLQKSGFKS